MGVEKEAKSWIDINVPLVVTNNEFCPRRIVDEEAELEIVKALSGASGGKELQDALLTSEAEWKLEGEDEKHKEEKEAEICENNVGESHDAQVDDEEVDCESLNAHNKKNRSDKLYDSQQTKEKLVETIAENQASFVEGSEFREEIEC